MKKILFALLLMLVAQSVQARYFDPEAGRFNSRDPLGYIDGMGLYNGYFAQRFQTDPSGTTTEGDDKECCICIKEPEKCFLEYMPVGKPEMSVDKGAKGGTVQTVGRKYFLILKHTEAKSTCGCHIKQMAGSATTWLKKRHAVPDDKPKDAGDKFFSFAAGFTTYIIDLDDYEDNKTKCIGGYATIRDDPGRLAGNHRFHTNLFSQYVFRAQNYVKEAPQIKSNYQIKINFNWQEDKTAKMSWNEKSSDGKMNSSGNK